MEPHPAKKSCSTLGLFILTFVTTTLAGSEWVYGRKSITALLVGGTYSWSDFVLGIAILDSHFFSFSGVHEFGHYFTAISLPHQERHFPYYIPLPPLFAF